MKRIIAILTCVVLCIMSVPMVAHAEEYTLTYEINGEEVTITKYDGTPVNVTIPEEIGDNAFYSCNALSFVIYDGTEEEWREVSVGGGNDCLDTTTEATTTTTTKATTTTAAIPTETTVASTTRRITK